MTSRLARSLALAAATLVATTGAVLATAPAASAAPVFDAPYGPVVGDLTGDGVADRVSLGTLTKPDGSYVCAFQFSRGLGHGAYGSPKAAALPVQDAVPAGGTTFCPDLGTVLRGPTASQRQLAVAWFDFGPYDGPSVQTFSGFGTAKITFTGGFDGIYQPTSLHSRDVDGDGWGDVYEYTDQGGPTAFFVGRGTNWHSLDVSPPAAYYSTEQFFDLNRNGGTDVLATYSDSAPRGLGVTVVDGRTGAKQVLATADYSDPSVTDTGFDVSVVDLDHDAYPDLQLVTRVFDDEGGTTTTTQRFVNQSKGGRWYFKPVTST